MSRAAAHPVSQGRRTKIVATLGPASASREQILALAQAGMDIARINGSHGSHQAHTEAIAAVRAAAETLGRPLCVLFDLQGPKIRLGKFDTPRPVTPGARITLTCRRPPVGGELPCDYDALDRDVEPGAALLIDDGTVHFEVVEVAEGRVVAQAKNAGILLPRKGINLPESTISAPAITAKDRADAAFALEAGVDLVAMSFVRRAKDIEGLATLLDELGGDKAPPIIAKIEKPQALDDLEAILRASWGVMVARGDLGVELSVAEVPMAQKRIIRAANRLGRPVITATQMLDSMTRNPSPTRAEASDVANAVLDGTDAVMLSQESASGLYPESSVATMRRIVEITEAHAERPLPPAPDPPLPQAATPAAVAEAGCAVARALGAKALVVFTESGRIAHRVSQHRPDVRILAFAHDAHLRQRLSLVWGVTPLRGGPSPTMQARMAALDATLLARGDVALDDHIVLLVGGPSAPSGSTNLLLVHRVGQSQPLPALLADPQAPEAP